jgi:hypothetical protein
MGMFKGSSTSSGGGGGDGDGGGLIAQLMREHPEMRSGKKRNYNEDLAASRAANPGVQMMKKGGSASARADGCAVKGKTRGRFV